ncbi:MAG: sigma-54-dependent transcriptional regulator [Betaproteobacteria bacterium]
MMNIEPPGTYRSALADVVDPAQFMTDRALRVRELSIQRWGEARAIEMVGLSPRFVELQAKLEKFARYHEPVLVTGESGVGKEGVAQAVYLLGTPPGRPYVSVNCPQHQDANLTVSELFGHTKGSFTGAIADRKGAFEEADGGVIFLDEVGDLHLTAQAMLLRTLQVGEFKPLGATRARSASVRVVSATNRSLNTLVVTNQFRYDLLFRLWYFQLAVPPLRDRGDDWRLIIDYRLLNLARKYGVAKRFSAASLRLLEGYSWPGNVRQLTSLVTMGYAMADADLIEPEDFASEMAKAEQTSGVDQPAPVPPAPPAPKREVDRDLELYARLTAEGDFWRLVYEPFMERDLNREQVKTIIRKGLADVGGNYRRMIESFRLPGTDYQRFMDFLRHHDLKP